MSIGKLPMNIAGLQKTSLLDFPGKVSAIIFTQGCNFTCPYCHNAELIPHKKTMLSTADIFEFLKKRKNVLQGVVITGGEPTLQEKLIDFCSHIKSMGYALKLDTNGSNPEMIQQLLKEKHIDYLAMDIKADPACYPKDICSSTLTPSITKTLNILKGTHIPHEFRIPCVAPFITTHMFSSLVAYVQKKSPIYLQQVHLKNIANPFFFDTTKRPLTLQEIANLHQKTKKHELTCILR